MHGVYVATPAPDLAPYVPPGWDIDWPFPGPPYPPGWEPEDPTPDDDSDDYDEEEEEAPDYSLTASGPAEISVSSPSVEIVAYLLDGVVATNEPLGYAGKCATAKHLTVSATIDGEERTVNGESSVDIAYESVGDYWGFSETLAFGVIAASDQGKTLVVNVTTSPYMPTPYDDKAELISEATTVSILVATAPPGIEVDCVISGNESWASDPPHGYFFKGDLYLTRKIGFWETSYNSYAVCTFSNTGDVENPNPIWANPTVPAFLYTHPNVSEIEPDSVEGLLTMRVEEAAETEDPDESVYWVSIKQQHTRIDSSSANVTIRTYVGGVLHDTKTFSRTNEASLYTFTTVFATIDGVTGDITLLDPPVTTWI